ncbi:MAG: type I 3-dehydroquinate dehydratase [Syntrophobacteraceae bacterium]
MREIKKPALCGCLVDAPVSDLPDVMRRSELDMLEWRLDLFAENHSWGATFEALSVLTPDSSSRLPVLATNRPKEQGGAFDGPEFLRIDALLRAASAGAEWVDLEADASDGALERLRSRDVGILLSHHDFAGTPDSDFLRRKLESMARRGADALKLITYAREPSDNLRALDLIAFGRGELGMDVIAFCMGPLGRWSRIACLLLGSPWTYVQLPGQSGSAPGQLSPSDARSLLEALQ